MSTTDATTTINGRQYYVVQLPAEKAIPLQMELMRLLGGGLTQLISALRPGSNLDNGERTVAMASAFNTIFQAATPEELSALIFRVVSTAKVDGERVEINKHFQAEYLADMYKVFFWVIGVNFASFFGAGGLAALADKFKGLFLQELAAQNSPKTPPQTSTPTSGDQ